MPSRNDHVHDLDRWEAAIAERASLTSVRRLRLLDPEGVSIRLLETRVGVGDSGATSVWLAGGRAGLRTGLQRVLTDALGRDRRWYLQWILGRWPRGPITLSLPLSSDDGAMALGIIAPLTPTREALSESPCPLDQSAVSHFKALHAATGCAGLSGCRMGLTGGDVDALIGRWEPALARLRPAAEVLELGDLADSLILPTIEGLSAGSAAPPAITIEVAYAPAPVARLVVEVGPVRLAHFAGLIASAFGEDRVAPLAASARALAQRTAFRARVEFDATGLRAAAALTAPRGQTVRRERRW